MSKKTTLAISTALAIGVVVALHFVVSPSPQFVTLVFFASIGAFTLFLGKN